MDKTMLCKHNIGTLFLRKRKSRINRV